MADFLGIADFALRWGARLVGPVWRAARWGANRARRLISAPAPTPVEQSFPSDEQLLFTRYSARVEIPEPDSGKIEIMLDAANLTSSPVDAVSVEVMYRPQLGSYTLDEYHTTLRAHGSAPGRSVGQFKFALPLSPAAIRSALRGISPASNALSSPHAGLHVQGALKLRCGNVVAERRLECNIYDAYFQVSANAIGLARDGVTT